MLGYVEYEYGSGRARMTRETRLGGTFLVLNMGRGAHGPLAARRAARAATQMYREGVRRAVFPVDFPHTAVFLRNGVRPVDPMPLRKALCVPYAKAKLAAMGLSDHRAVIAIAGEYMTSEIAEITRSLALSYRYVMLSVRSGGAELAKELRRQYGISLLLDPSGRQMDRAHLLILFAPRSDLRQENPILCSLYPDCGTQGQIPLRMSSDLLAEVPQNCCTEQLAAALYSMGILPFERLLAEITC